MNETLATFPPDSPLEVIQPEGRDHWLGLRTKDVTSTELAALFGCSPHTTKFELWHRKKSQVVVELEENERMKWGTRLQDSIAHGVAEDEKWEVRRMDEYIRHKELRMGASFDFSVMNAENKFGLLEIKNVDGLVYRQNWLKQGEEVEAPPHIELQVQQQLFLTGRSFAYIGALVGGNNLVLLRREPREKMFNAMRAAVTAFWTSIDSNQCPEPDFARDADFICGLYAESAAGKTLNALELPELAKLAEEYTALGKQEKMLQETRDGLKARILMAIGDAERVEGMGFSISSKMIGGKMIQYERKGYRDFRVNWKLKKELSNG